MFENGIYWLCLYKRYWSKWLWWNKSSDSPSITNDSRAALMIGAPCNYILLLEFAKVFWHAVHELCISKHHTGKFWDSGISHGSVGDVLDGFSQGFKPSQVGDGSPTGFPAGWSITMMSNRWRILFAWNLPLVGGCHWCKSHTRCIFLSICCIRKSSSDWLAKLCLCNVGIRCHMILTKIVCCPKC